jgi:zinc protease
MNDVTRRTALKGAATLAVLPLAVPALAQTQETPPPRADRPLFGAVHWTLPNGLRVVLAENRRAPVAAHYLYVSAGAGEDPAGKSGVAHFLEHMMFKGSPNVPSGAFSRTVSGEGGQDNAFTSRDVTAYFQIVEATRLPLMMRMEADRLGGAIIPQAEFDPERNVVLEERRSRTDSVPQGRFREAFDAAMWGPQHWRGRPLIGWEPEIRAITRDDLAAFHAAHYTPANCVLIVAGDVREADLRRWADEFYGPVPRPPRQPAQPPQPAGCGPRGPAGPPRPGSARGEFPAQLRRPFRHLGDHRHGRSAGGGGPCARRRPRLAPARRPGGKRPRDRRRRFL